MAARKKAPAAKKSSSTHWFHKMTPKQKKAYIAKHPNSIYAAGKTRKQRIERKQQRRISESARPGESRSMSKLMKLFKATPNGVRDPAYRAHAEEHRKKYPPLRSDPY